MNNCADLNEFGSLSDGESAFLEFYRALDDESQTKFYRVAEAMADESVTMDELEEIIAAFNREATFKDEEAFVALQETGAFAAMLRSA